MDSSGLFQAFCVLVSLAFLSAQPSSFEDCNRPIDIVFSLDGSDAVTSAVSRDQVGSINNVVQRLNIGQSFVNVGAVHFGGFISLIDLQSTVAGFEQESMPWGRIGGATSTNLGLFFANDVFSSSSRPSTPRSRVVILISNGRSSNSQMTFEEARRLREDNTYISAVGVGLSVSRQELETVTGDVDSVFIASQSSGFQTALERAVRRACFSTSENPSPTSVIPSTEEPAPTAATQAPQAPVCSYGNIEMFLLVDVSGRAETFSNDFLTLRNSLNAFVDVVSTQRQPDDDVRIGLISYSDNANVVFNTDFSNTFVQVRNAVRNLPNGLAQGGSNLSLALSRIQTTALRSDYRSYVLIITPNRFSNGLMRQQVAREIERIGALGYTVVTMPVGTRDNINLQPVEELASSERYNFPASGYTGLETSLRTFVSEILCGSRKRQGLCASSGRERNGNAYASHPFYCELYLQCYYRPEDDFDLSIIRECPPGLYWNDNLKRCDSPRNSQCPQDPCRQGECEMVPMTTSCRGYFDCRQSYSTAARCCQKNFRFVSGRGCVNDTVAQSCEDDCFSNYTNYTTCRQPSCRKSPNWSSAGTYYLNLRNSTFQRIRSCFGNDFHATRCDCSAGRDQVCNPDFMISFTNAATVQELRSDRPRMSGVSVANAVFGAEGITLVERGQIHLDASPFVNNSPVMLKFRYRETPGTIPTSSSLLMMTSTYNCEGCNGKLTMEIGPVFILASFEASDGNIGQVAVYTTGLSPTEFKDVILIYNPNGRIFLSVKGEFQQYIREAKAPRDLAFPGGFDFGSTTDDDRFMGTFESMSLSSCVPAKIEG